MFGQHQSPNLNFGSCRFSVPLLSLIGPRLLFEGEEPGLEAGGDGSFSGGDGDKVGRRAGGAGCCLQKSGLSRQLLRYLRFYRLFLL